MKKTISLVLSLMMILGVTAGVFAVVPPDKNIVETAVEAPDFNTLVGALVLTGLDEALGEIGPFTVFAPTDAAFAALPEGILNKLLDNHDILAKVLLYHVVEGDIRSTDLVDGAEVTTLQGQKVTISLTGGTFINEAEVNEADILCSNGVIHIIDSVLVPEWDIVEAAILHEDFNTLVAALTIADLVDALKGTGPFTVFAPTDAAFDALPEGLLDTLVADPETLAKVLLYHVVSGEFKKVDVIDLDGDDVETLLGQDVTVSLDDGKVYINSAQVIITDVECTNGVIHVLDAVLVPDLEEDEDPVDLPATGGTAGLLALGFLLAGAGLAFMKRRG